MRRPGFGFSLLAERGIDISHETVRFWWNRFGPMFAAEIRKRRVAHMRGYPQWRWHLDEVFVKVNGKLCYLWRAVDHEGEILEAVVTARRDKAAALKLLKRIMKRYGQPRKIVTDGLCSYSAAMKELGNADRHEVGGRLDLVILIDAHQRHDWLMAAVEKRLREELAVAAVSNDAGEARANLRLDLRDDGLERVAVVRISGQRLHVGDELPALRFGLRRRLRKWSRDAGALMSVNAQGSRRPIVSQSKKRDKTWTSSGPDVSPAHRSSGSR